LPAPDPTRLAESLGAVIRAERGDRSQEALADLADLHRNEVGKIERGEISPSIQVLAQISYALGLLLAELLGRAEDALPVTPDGTDE